MDEYSEITELKSLNNNLISQLPEKVKGFCYNRSDLRPGILHIGVGNFHRAHQAWYLHRLFEKGLNFDWAIVGAGVCAFDKLQREKLKKQDFLSTLIELNPNGTSAELIGSIIDYVEVEETNQALIKAMVSPEIKIVSLTVTEGGYYMNSASKDFNIDHPDIRKDIENPSSPRTVFGVMVEALRLRRQLGYGPVTGLSCDNLEKNGVVLHRAVTKLAEQIDPDLAQWISENCSFPCSMVDCIVPSTGPYELELVRQYSLNDKVPVTHENFRQWVIEDDFCAGRPDLEKVGVIFTKKVHYYETMKIRLLNGGHQIIANVGELLSLVTISDCMQDTRIASLFVKILSEEIAPHLVSVPDKTPVEYIELIQKRFSNPTVVDTTRRVAFDGSSRHPGFLVPSINTAVEAGSSISGLALAEAIWARMCEGTREDGSKIEPNDPNWSDLERTAMGAKEKPSAWLDQRQYYGDLNSNKIFSDTFANWLRKIWNSGVEAAIDDYLR